jgi:hypothetical protein
MNRLLLRRFTVNVFWTLVYGSIIGYVCYYNVFNEREIANKLENSVVHSVVIQENNTKGI